MYLQNMLHRIRMPQIQWQFMARSADWCFTRLHLKAFPGNFIPGYKERISVACLQAFSTLTQLDNAGPRRRGRASFGSYGRARSDWLAVDWEILQQGQQHLATGV
jgi:hypothetical protein